MNFLCFFCLLRPEQLPIWFYYSIVLMHRAMGTIAVKIAARTFSSPHYARATLFQRHATLLVANNAICLTSGFNFEVQVVRLETKHDSAL